MIQIPWLASDQNTLMENRDIYTCMHITPLDVADKGQGSTGKYESYGWLVLARIGGGGGGGGENTRPAYRRPSPVERLLL